MQVAIKKTVGVAMKNHRKRKAKHREIYAASVGSAMKRAADSAKTEAKKDVASAAGIKQKAIKGRLGITRRPRGERITIYYSGAMMPPEAFSNLRQTRRGVRAGKKSYDGAFLAKSTRGRTSGKTTVFKRTGPGRGPITRMGENMELFKNHFIRGARRGFQKTYPKRLVHEYDRRMKKAGLK